MPAWRSVEGQWRAAEQRGELDGLAGAGRPIADLDRPRDELWWVKRLLAREDLRLTPPALALRKELDELPVSLDRLRREDDVRAALDDFNARVRRLNSRATAGPPSTVMPVDVDAHVAAWRARRPAPRSAPLPTAEPRDVAAPPPARRRSWVAARLWRPTARP